MPWTCSCSATNADSARFCSRCGQPLDAPSWPESTAVPPPPIPGAQRPQPAGGLGLKIGIIAGVLLIGGMFGTMVARAVFGGGSPVSASAPARSSSTTDPNSSFQAAFDASFKNTCRQSAMRSGHVSSSTADMYCDCALNAFHQHHNMLKAAETCRAYIGR